MAHAAAEVLGDEKGRGKKIGDERRNPSGGKGEECELERVRTFRREELAASGLMYDNRWKWKGEKKGRLERSHRRLIHLKKVVEQYNTIQYSFNSNAPADTAATRLH